MADTTDYCWFVYYEDYSGFTVFDRELAALRYAVSRSMKCIKIPFGVEDIKEYIREASNG